MLSIPFLRLTKRNPHFPEDVNKSYQRVGVECPPSFLFLLPKNHRWPMSPLFSTPTPTVHLSGLRSRLSRSPNVCHVAIVKYFLYCPFRPIISPLQSTLRRPLLSSPLRHRHLITFSSPIGQSGYTEVEIKVCTWLREIYSCSCLTVLPGPAWGLLSKTNKPLFPPLYFAML